MATTFEGLFAHACDYCKDADNTVARYRVQPQGAEPVSVMACFRCASRHMEFADGIVALGEHAAALTEGE